MRPIALYDLYVRWCNAFGLDPSNRIVFGKRLSHLGFKKTRSDGKDFWCVKITDAGREILKKPVVKEENVEPSVPEAVNDAEGGLKDVA